MLVFTNTSFTDRETYPNPAPNAVTMNGSYLELINCIVQNGQQGIQCSASAVDHLVYGCLISLNGLVPGYGHGAYVQNANSAGKRYLDCIFIDNFGANFAPHGFDGKVDYITLRESVLANAGSPVSTARNNLYWDNAETIENPILENNYIYQGQASPVQNRLGDPDNATNGVQVSGNYIVNLTGALALYGSTIEIDILSDNEFYGTTLGWDTASYPDNVHSLTTPVSGKKVGVISNEYATRRAHVVIYNYDLSDIVEVDISSLGWTGQVTARNVQDYFTDIQTLDIVDSAITINMQAANRTVEAPTGWTAPASTFPQFGAFVLERV